LVPFSPLAAVAMTLFFGRSFCFGPLCGKNRRSIS